MIPLREFYKKPIQAVSPSVQQAPNSLVSFKRRLRWILCHSNKDRGWSTFEFSDGQIIVREKAHYGSTIKC